MMKTPLLPITNAEFDILEVDGGAPDWYTASPILDFWFEMEEGDLFTFRVEWPSQEQISEAVVSGLSSDARSQMLSPRFSFPTMYGSLKALLAIQPLLMKIVESKPSGPGTFAEILKEHGFLDHERHFLSNCE